MARLYYNALTASCADWETRSDRVDNTSKLDNFKCRLKARDARYQHLSGIASH